MNVRSENARRFLFVPSVVAAFILLFFTTNTAVGRDRFVEDDWIAWGRATIFTDLDVGSETIYISTDAGILRWSRLNNTWLDPWATVPGPLNQAICLLSAQRVREDPLTRDVYVLTPSGWFRRDFTRQRWDEVGWMDSMLSARLRLDKYPDLRPTSSQIVPYPYNMNADGTLLMRSQSWEYELGISEEWGKSYYCWRNFGVGVLDKYAPVLDLYPMGPGKTFSMAFSDTSVWCASILDHDLGWLWSKNTDSARWKFLHPDETWGLETGIVHEIQLDGRSSVWLATNNGLMIVSESGGRHLRKRDGLPREDILDVQTVAGGAWVATQFGLAFIVNGSYEIVRPVPQEQPLVFSGYFAKLAAAGDTVYAAGPGALMKLIPGHIVWENLPLPAFAGRATSPTGLYVDGEHIILADENGVAWRDTEDLLWHELPSNFWRNERVLSIESHGGYFWLGTTRGLARLNPENNAVLMYTQKDGLCGSAVYDIVGDEEYLWLGTDRALVRFRWYVEGRVE